MVTHTSAICGKEKKSIYPSIYVDCKLKKKIQKLDFFFWLEFVRTPGACLFFCGKKKQAMTLVVKMKNEPYIIQGGKKFLE